MMQEFENLSAKALGLADDDLAHIADTEQLTDAENDRIAANVLGRLNLTPVQPVPIVKKNRKRRIRIIGTLIAAVIAVGALGLGVSGWVNYNRRQAQKYFGEIGTAKLEELGYAARQQSFSNGKINASLTAVLCDGSNALALLTFEPADPEEKIDWDLELYGMQESGQTENQFCKAFPQSFSRRVYDSQCWVTLEMRIGDLSEGDQFTFRFDKQETNFPTEEEIKKWKKDKDGMFEDHFESPEFIGRHDPYFNEYSDGLEITVPLTTNVPSVTIQSERGDTMELSGIALSGQSWIPGSPCFTAVYADGTEKELFYMSSGTTFVGGPEGSEEYYSYAKIYEAIDGVTFRMNDPSTYNGFIDVTQIESVELGGTVYTRTE